ncbi:MAG: hypothetical protein M3Q33_12560 [Acidobacteriota bacterium]|nr:hypothetical protein [Acidobacteriota bacterium]
MAREYTNSLEKADIVTREIFLVIWRYAARDSVEFDKPAFITLMRVGD